MVNILKISMIYKKGIFNKANFLLTKNNFVYLKRSCHFKISYIKKG